MFAVEGGFGGLVFWVGFTVWWFLSFCLLFIFYLGFYVADLSILLFGALAVLGGLLWFVVWIETRVWVTVRRNF